MDALPTNGNRAGKPAPPLPSDLGRNSNVPDDLQRRIPDRPTEKTGKDPQKRRPQKGEVGKRVVLAAAALLVVAAGGFWTYTRMGTGGPGMDTDAPQVAAISSGGDSQTIRAFNISMLGLVAANDNALYTSESGVLETGDGNRLLRQPLYYMNAEPDGVYGVDLRGQICKVDSAGNLTVLREEGHPSFLLVVDGSVYFVEDGLRRMNLDGTGETLLAEGSVASAALAVYGEMVYYTGGANLLYRVPIGGGAPEQVSGLPVERFCIDGGKIYLTVQGGDGSLWQLGDDGTYTAVSNAMMGTPSPRFAVSNGTLYFGGENTPVYQNILGGNVVQVVSSKSCGLFYILDYELYALPDMPATPLVEYADPEE